MAKVSFSFFSDWIFFSNVLEINSSSCSAFACCSRHQGKWERKSKWQRVNDLKLMEKYCIISDFGQIIPDDWTQFPVLLQAGQIIFKGTNIMIIVSKMERDFILQITNHYKNEHLTFNNSFFWHTIKALVSNHSRNSKRWLQLELGPVSQKSQNFFGRIILFESSQLRRLEALNYPVIFIFIPLTLTYEKISFTE